MDTLTEAVNGLQTCLAVIVSVVFLVVILLIPGLSIVSRLIALFFLVIPVAIMVWSRQERFVIKSRQARTLLAVLLGVLLFLTGMYLQASGSGLYLIFISVGLFAEGIRSYHVTPDTTNGLSEAQKAEGVEFIDRE